MKRFATAIALMAIGFIFCLNADSQPRHEEGCSWKERIMSEKIAFFTGAIGITPQEAQAFWPVYNQMQDAKDKAREKMFAAFGELSKAASENRNSGEMSSLLEKYLDALEEMKMLDITAAEKYKSVLPVEKVAKLYIAEEDFRRAQITKLHKRNDQPQDRK